MATSRTGTGKYRHWRTRILHNAQTEGVTHCPCTWTCRHHPGRSCGVRLDYDNSRRPNSAEPDHITPHANGGRETTDNGRAICRRCNQASGNRRTVKAKPTSPLTPNHSDW